MHKIQPSKKCTGGNDTEIKILQTDQGDSISHFPMIRTSQRLCEELVTWVI